MQETEELIKHAQSGSTEAFEELVFLNDRRIVNIITHYARSSDDAKDLYQEIFLRAYKGLRGFRFQSEFSTWLHRIAVNTCLTYCDQKKKSRTVPLEEQPESEEPERIYRQQIADMSKNPERDLHSKEVKKQLRSAINFLPPKQKMVFLLKHDEGYLIREIAEIMDCTEGTVKKYLFLAVERLRNLLADIVYEA